MGRILGTHSLQELEKAGMELSLGPPEKSVCLTP